MWLIDFSLRISNYDEKHLKFLESSIAEETIVNIKFEFDLISGSVNEGLLDRLMRFVRENVKQKVNCVFSYVIFNSSEDLDAQLSAINSFFNRLSYFSNSFHFLRLYTDSLNTQLDNTKLKALNLFYQTNLTIVGFQ